MQLFNEVYALIRLWWVGLSMALIGLIEFELSANVRASHLLDCYVRLGSST